MPGLEKRGWGFKHTAKQLASAAQQKVVGRYTDNKGFKFTRLAKDLVALKRIVHDNINAEKKRFQFMPNANGLVGQIANNGSGHFIEDITPVMNQGTGEENRVGNSVKVASTFGRLVLRNNAIPGQNAPTRFRHYIVQVKGDPYTTMTAFLVDFLSPNKYLQAYNAIDIYDYFSERNPQSYTKFKVLRNKVIKAGGDTVNNMFQQTETVIKLKYKDLHLKWEGNLSSIANNGQIISLLLADRGNCGNTASTLLGLSDTAVNTGWAVDRYYTHYIVDN